MATPLADIIGRATDCRYEPPPELLRHPLRLDIERRQLEQKVLLAEYLIRFLAVQPVTVLRVVWREGDEW